MMISGCSQKEQPAPPAPGSVAQRVSDLETYVNNGAAKQNADTMAAEAQADLIEIRKLGLVDRAHRDFTNHLPGSQIEELNLGYFRDTNLVWCSVYYRSPTNAERQSHDFGYKRVFGTNWDLIWSP
ncbi:MAG TPA: hypothetical protein VLT36_18230 [Candidatus Dormibacteraeota bacterium]|nr:hypothetical protein [Candidatus Dormibacteraeota bacterium]